MTNFPPAPLKQSVIIFDWDDTICPSSFVDECNIQGINDLPLHYQNLMHEIARVAEKCLETAAKYGEVLIITNSDEGWVKYSAERYVPNLVPVLDNYRIISARTRYERFYPDQPLCWKAAAFAHEVNETFLKMKDMHAQNTISDEHQDSIASLASTEVSSQDSFFNEKDATSPSKCEEMPFMKEIMSFGDSMEERTALKIVSSQLCALPKSVMFVTSPTPMQLIGQLTMLTSKMKYICTYDKDLDLEISGQQAHKCAEYVLGKSAKVEQQERGQANRFIDRLRQGRTQATSYMEIDGRIS